MKLSGHEARVLAMIEDEFRLHDPEWLEQFDDFTRAGRGREDTARSPRYLRLRKLLGILLLAPLVAVPLTTMPKSAPWVPLDRAYRQVTNLTVSAVSIVGMWADEQVKGAEARICQSAGTACR